MVATLRTRASVSLASSSAASSPSTYQLLSARRTSVNVPDGFVSVKRSIESNGVEVYDES
jgi:hypothetical protein